jgi:aspartyl-tRNA(Asn)/glutamyl-tRNA(Gln) amidotransferase subunit A
VLGSGLENLRSALLNGEASSVDLVAEALGRIADHAGEGPRTFISVYGESALLQAKAADKVYAAGKAGALSLLGIPVSIKDLFDIEGEVTTAGSLVLGDAPPAREDAKIVARLRNAGAVIVGRTNMTELAFSGLGLNPHYGTPKNPWDRTTSRIPGGSSSGAAVSVSDRMCAVAIGTDTGGSVRIPAALCGLTGFKPTQASVPLQGTYPLSPTLDSIGPIGRTVSDCALLFDILGNTSHEYALPASLRLAVPVNYVTDGIDAAVDDAFEAAVARLERAGHVVERIEVPGFNRFADVARIGSFASIEAYAAQRALLRDKAALYDPRVRVRLEAGGCAPADALPRLHHLRAEITADIAETLAPYDAFLYPTVPIVAPAISDLDRDEAYTRANLLMLRNPTVVNFVDGCAVSLPVHRDGEAPVGMSVAGLTGTDRRILAIARHVEQLVEAGREGR